jgi:hypothetical protein
MLMVWIYEVKMPRFKTFLRLMFWILRILYDTRILFEGVEAWRPNFRL